MANSRWKPGLFQLGRSSCECGPAPNARSKHIRSGLDLNAGLFECAAKARLDRLSHQSRPFQGCHSTEWHPAHDREPVLRPSQKIAGNADVVSSKRHRDFSFHLHSPDTFIRLGAVSSAESAVRS